MKPSNKNREFRARVSGPARRVFIRIAEVWSLTERQQVDLLALNDLRALDEFRRQSDEPLSEAILIRISNVLKIYRALRILFPHGEIANGWVQRPNSNPIFGGTPALVQMTTRQLSDLVRVREYLEAQSWAH